MKRTVLLGATLLAAAMLHAQGFQQPRRFPPEIRLPPEIGPATFTVTGVNGKPVEISMADVVNFPQHTIKAADHGAPVTFQGVLLKDVLAKVDLPVGDQFHKTAASYYLVVEAADGYHAVFAWAELDPTFMDKALYLVTHRDGKPLSSSEGPFELVAPGEKRNARWVRQVTSLAIRQAS
jgi:Oxidoreductase molybdopterin binding domain